MVRRRFDPAKVSSMIAERKFYEDERSSSSAWRSC
jgi:hypothetical protein